MAYCAEGNGAHNTTLAVKPSKSMPHTKNVDSYHLGNGKGYHGNDDWAEIVDWPNILTSYICERKKERET